MDNEKRKTILDFLHGHKLGVIATLNQEKGKPEAALVAFSETDNCELIFGTFADTRKYTNLQKNPQVAFVIGLDDEEDITLQYEGAAREVFNGELKECQKIHVLKNPSSEKYAYDEKQRFFRVTPNWIRYSNLSSDLTVVFEIDRF